MTIFGAEIPFPAHCGIEEVGVFDGGARIRLAAQPHHLNNIGLVHGGVICTMLDVAMGSTCRVAVGSPMMTLDMQVAFIAPGRGALLAEGRILRQGRSLIYVEATVTAETDGTLVAKGSGIFKVARAAEEKAPAQKSV